MAALAGEHEETRDGKTVKVWLADNTVARRCGIAKQFFRAALRKGLCCTNPFADLKAALKRNTARHYFVTPAEAQGCWTPARTPSGGCCSP